MKKHTLYGIMILLSAFIISSCNKNKIEQTKHIPKDATFVLSISPSSIYEKLKDHKDQLDSVVKIFSERVHVSDSSKKSGEALLGAINKTQPVFFFVQTKNSIAEGNSVMSGTVVALSDGNKFEDFIKKQSANSVISKDNGISFTDIKDGVIGWNNKIAIFLFNIGNSNALESKTQLESLFDLKESESLADNKSFTSSFNATSDISFYANYSQSLSSVPFLAMTKASDLVKDMYYAGTLNFNDGSIDINATGYPNATLLDLIKKNPAPELDGKTFENYPDKPLGIFDFSLNLKQVIGILNYIGVDQMIEPFLTKQGLSFDDVAAAFKGEIVVAVSNFQMKQQTIPGYNMTTSTPSVDFLVKLPIADKKAYDKIVNTLAKLGLFVAKNGQLVPAVLAQEGDGSIAYVANNDAVFVASSPTLIDNVVSGKNHSSLPDDITKNIKGKTSYFYVDIQSLLGNIPVKESDDSALLSVSKNTFKDFSAWGNTISGKSQSGEAHIKFVDTKQNSLISLLTFIQSMKTAADKYKPVISIADSSANDMNTNIPVPPTVDTTK
ncbi:hypothetical protein A9P82_11945 [Arachidicoccus ginsenosidimutans]|uniref:DUF4836 family protein n=1 Tax=Arachidicoccus sp. BS20 TaxID=1850526 RepID=UPI0007F15623|nr:DUF4836 family protein [Arachidicoccus sp. BS20]ANI89937.1 hypothetical protein A9P82_11945 [Arachidicoccus sp. BS20]